VLGSPDLDAFIRARRWAVMTTLRSAGAPASSVVGYALEGDDFLVAADRGSLKLRCLERDPSVTLCIVSDDPHPRFATVEGRGAVERERLEQARARLLADTLPPGHSASKLEAWLMRPATLVLRVRAVRVWGELRPAI